MTRSAAILLAVCVLSAPVAVQAGTAIQGFGLGSSFGVPTGAATPAAAGSFGAPLAADGFDQAAALPEGELGSPRFRYTLVSPVAVAAGQQYGERDTAGGDGSVLALTDFATGGDAVLDTASAPATSHFALPDVGVSSGVPLNGKFSFRGIASRLPEPATWGLMILGFGAIGGAMRFHIRRSEARFTAKLRRIAAGGQA